MCRKIRQCKSLTPDERHPGHRLSELQPDLPFVSHCLCATDAEHLSIAGETCGCRGPTRSEPSGFSLGCQSRNAWKQHRRCGLGHPGRPMRIPVPPVQGLPSQSWCRPLPPRPRLQLTRPWPSSPAALRKLADAHREPLHHGSKRVVRSSTHSRLSYMVVVWMLLVWRPVLRRCMLYVGYSSTSSEAKCDMDDL